MKQKHTGKENTPSIYSRTNTKSEDLIYVVVLARKSMEELNMSLKEKR
jgi:hypothetical protein